VRAWAAVLQSAAANNHAPWTALIQRESAKRLALLGGSEPLLEQVPRRQPEPA